MSAKGRGPTAKSIISRMRYSKLGWTGALGELIDNACGNGAKTVTIDIAPPACTIRDDGAGCTEKMFIAIQSIGAHEDDPDGDNPTSRYGVGSKDAVIWAGGPTEYFSVRDEARYCRVEWDSFGDEFDYPLIRTGAAAQKKCASVKLPGHGTVIRMPAITRQMTKSIFESLCKSLTAQHWAAVETGVIIRLRFCPHRSKRAVEFVLPGKPMPALLAGHAIDSDVQLADGRLIHISGGVLDPSVRLSSPGFEYIFGHRIVSPCSGLGAGQMSFERVYFRVLLLGEKTSWAVNANKDGLHDADVAALGEAVYHETKRLLEFAQGQSVASLLDQDLEEKLSEMLTSANRKRAKRSPAENATGAVEPRESGRRQANAAEVGERDGNCKASKTPGRIGVHFAEFDDDAAHLLGRAAVRDKVVRLNALHPAVSARRESGAASELFLIAFALWSDAWIKSEDSGQGRLIVRCDFPEKFSAMLEGAALSAETASA